MRNALSSFAHRTFERLGLQVHLSKNVRRAQAEARVDRELKAWSFLAHRPIRTVLDIGANTGQFASIIAQVCPDVKIHSFEPLAECFAELERALATIPGAEAYPFALGEEASQVEMFHSDFSPSSSLLKMTERHVELFPKSGKSHKETIEVRCLDDVAEDEMLEGELLVKIDVQGYELPVIRGGRDTLRKASAVVIEVNFDSLYEGQPTFAELHDELLELGLRYRGQIEQFTDPATGRPIFADVYFERGH